MTPTSIPGGNGHSSPNGSTRAMASFADSQTAVPSTNIPALNANVGAAKPKPSGPRHILELLFRRRKVALTAFVGVMVVAVLTSWSSRRIYQSTASLLVNTAPVEGDSKRGDSTIGSEVEGVNQSRKLETQMEILRTSSVMKGAIDLLSPAERAALAGFSGVEITAVRNTDLLSVTAKSYSPEAAAALANAICESYIDQSQVANRAEIASAGKYVKSQLDNVTIRLEKARNALKRFQEENGVSDIQAQSSAITTELSQVKNDLRQARTERASAAAQISALQSAADRTPKEIVTSNSATPPAYIALRQQLTTLQLNRITARAKFQPTSRTVQDIDSQIASVQKRLATEPRTEVSGTQRAANPARAAIDQELARVQSQVRAYDARIVVLTASLGRSNTELSQLPDKISRFGQLQGEVTTLEENYRQLGQKQQALRISEEARLANARLASQAQPSGAPIGSSRARTLMMAALLGAALAYGLSMLLDKMDERIHSTEEAEDAAQLPVMIDVPFIKHRENQVIGNENANGYALRENFEMLGTQLRILSRSTPINSVSITSSLPGEGKSMSSVNLAIAAALSGQRVVLADCDLRRPSLHYFFDLPNEKGFSDVVNGHCALQDALQATNIPNLQLLSSGASIENPLKLLSSPRAQECMDELTRSADLVIIDTPPALLIADAALLSTMADATLLVVSCNEVAQDEVQRAIHTLARSGAWVPGIILTKVIPLPGTQRDYSGYSARRNNGYANNAFQPVATAAAVDGDSTSTATLEPPRS